MLFSGGTSNRRYFTSRKGEIEELHKEQNSTNQENVKEAVKKVIASMTLGKDVSSLFTDVIKSMPTTDIELKKLVYLYIINYACSQPDKAIQVVNTFQRDAANTKNPQIRALAIRTMSCIRLEKIAHFLCDPLIGCQQDHDPYVRKTAAVCVAKLYDINSELVEEQGFIDKLRDMISDNNHTVVANVVTALVEISEASGKDMFKINNDMLHKLLIALDSCTEWGQVSILDFLAKYVPTPIKAEEIIERIIPRLKHANTAISMSTIKVIINYLDIIKDSNPILVKTLITQKLAPPQITLLLERHYGIQYVVLRNISLILQKYPSILENSIQSFYCKYNDPQYIKLEKLDIILTLVSDNNVDKVLTELNEYANEVDIDFVRHAIRTIGHCAIKLESCVDKCVNLLVALVKNATSNMDSRNNYILQEIVIVIKDILRKYTIDYETILPLLYNNLEILDDPDARASLIWIVGQYGECIDNACELLQNWIDTFETESHNIQLQLLTTTVKLFLKNPINAKDIVLRVFDIATKHADSPDVRDRAFIYWRLLSTDPKAAIQVVLTPKKAVEFQYTRYSYTPQVQNILLNNIASLSSVFHCLPETFVSAGHTIHLHDVSDDDDNENENDINNNDDDIDQNHENENDLKELDTGIDTKKSEYDTLTDTPNLIDLQQFDMPTSDTATNGNEQVDELYKLTQEMKLQPNTETNTISQKSKPTSSHDLLYYLSEDQLFGNNDTKSNN